MLHVNFNFHSSASLEKLFQGSVERSEHLNKLLGTIGTMPLKHLGFFATLGHSVNVQSSDENFESFRREPLQREYRDFPEVFRTESV